MVAAQEEGLMESSQMHFSDAIVEVNIYAGDDERTDINIIGKSPISFSPESWLDVVEFVSWARKGR